MADLKVLLLTITLCATAAQNAGDNGVDSSINYDPLSIDNDSSTEGDDVYDINDIEDLLRLDSENGSYYNSDVFDYANGDVGRDQAILRPLDTTVIVLYSIITVVGLIANAVVYFVIFAGNETGKTVTAIYVLHLTIADTIFLFMLPIFSMQKVSNTWNYGAFMCTFSQTIKFLNYYAGIFFLTAMSVDRYVAVAYGTRLSKVRTKKRTYWVCAGVWATAIVMSIPFMLYARLDEVGKEDGVTICRIMFPGYEAIAETDDQYLYITYGDESSANYDEDAVYDAGSGSSGVRDDREIEKIKYACETKSQPPSYFAWLIINFLVGFVTPFLVIVAMYAMILKHLKVAEEKIGHTATSKAAKMRKKVTTMVAGLVICFTICWLPHHLYLLVKMKGFDSTVVACHVTEEFFVALAFSNSALNPLLYTFMGNNFRERLRKSVRNTQLTIKRRRSSRSSMQKKSTHSHSDTHPSKKMAALIVRYHKSSSNGSTKENSQNGKAKKCQISLLNSKRDWSNCDINSGDGSQIADHFYGITSTMLENTMETHLETEMRNMRAAE